MVATGHDEMGALLADAGCDAGRIAELRCLAATGDAEALVRRLCRLRAELVAQMHESQRRLDSLDLLIFRIRRQGCRATDQMGA